MAGVHKDVQIDGSYKGIEGIHDIRKEYWFEKHTIM